MPENAIELIKKAIAAKVSASVAAHLHSVRAKGAEPKTFNFECV
jgi:hypothetical protein